MVFNSNKSCGGDQDPPKITQNMSGSPGPTYLAHAGRGDIKLFGDILSRKKREVLTLGMRGDNCCKLTTILLPRVYPLGHYCLDNLISA